MPDDETLQPAPAWSTKAGHSMLKPMAAGASGEAADRALIAERVYRYGYSLDERQTALIADNFTEDIVWEANIMGLIDGGTHEGPQAIAEYMTEFFAPIMDQRRHVFSNVIIDDYTGSTATVHAYLILMRSENAASEVLTTGPYRFEMRKGEDAVWRMSRLVAGFDSPF